MEQKKDWLVASTAEFVESMPNEQDTAPDNVFDVHLDDICNHEGNNVGLCQQFEVWKRENHQSQSKKLRRRVGSTVPGWTA